MKKIQDNFENLDLQGNGYKETQIGIFLTSPMQHLLQAFEIFLKKKYIQKNDIFLDAGSGDGRVVITSTKFGIESYGIEHDKKLVYKSQCNFNKYISKKSPFKIIEGDFLDNKTYSKLGKKFTDFTIIYNYANNYKQLAQKIEEESPKNTKFILCTGSKNMPIYKNLTLIDIKKISTTHILRKRFNSQEQILLGIPKLQTVYFFIYQK
jgi:hypothetical protein